MARARTDLAKDQKRLVLLDAAMDEFFERGFAAARMDDIARRANVSKGTLYLYFKSKEELFRSLIATFVVPNVERMEAAIHGAPSAHAAIEAITRLAPSIIRQTSIPRMMKILVADSVTFPDVLKAYKENVLDRFLSVIAGLLERANDAGEIEVDDPDVAAKLVVAPFVFSAFWQVIFNANTDGDLDLPSLFAMHAAFLEKAFVPGKAEDEK